MLRGASEALEALPGSCQATRSCPPGCSCCRPVQIAPHCLSSCLCCSLHVVDLCMYVHTFYRSKARLWSIL